MALVFRWSETKAKLNLSKHKIGFEEAKTVFNDPFVRSLFPMSIILMTKNVT